jgi:CRISPR system Cascade subunit CasE
MILSRICFNPLHPAVYKLAGDPYGLHIKLCQCFSACRVEAGILYRWEEGPVLLVQSLDQPDWSKLDLPDSALAGEPESKVFSPQFALGQTLAFRLRCRPSQKQRVEGSKNSKQRSLRTDEDRILWLERQGVKFGFALQAAHPMQERWRDTKPTASNLEAPAKRQRFDSLPATRFDGVLVVTDPEKLVQGVRMGIGPQKAYGFGLLSLSRI